MVDPVDRTAGRAAVVVVAETVGLVPAQVVRKMVEAGWMDQVDWFAVADCILVVGLHKLLVAVVAEMEPRLVRLDYMKVNHIANLIEELG